MTKYEVWYTETQIRVMACYVDADNPMEADILAHEKGFREKETLSFEESGTYVTNMFDVKEGINE